MATFTDIQSRIRAALRRGDTAEALRLQAQSGQPSMADVGQPFSSLNDAGPPDLWTTDILSPFGSAGIESQPPKPTPPKPNITQDDLNAATDPKTGKVNWWKLMAKTLAVPAATTAIGALLGGEKGAMYGAQAGGAAIKGFQEGKSAMEEVGRQHKKDDLAEQRQKSLDARQAALDADRKQAEADRKATADQAAADRKQAAQDKKDAADQAAADRRGKPEHYPEGSYVDVIDPATGKPQIGKDGQPVRRQLPKTPTPKEPAEKPPTTQEIAANLRNLTTEEEEIRGNREKGIPGRGTIPKDAEGNRIPNATRVFEPDDQARLDQIQEEKKYWRGLQSSLAKNKVLGKLAGAGKGKGATPELSPDDTKKYQDGIKAYRTNGWTDGEIHMKLRGAGLTDEQIKGLGIQ